jgi:hypothetical protein
MTVRPLLWCARCSQVLPVAELMSASAGLGGALDRGVAEGQHADRSAAVEDEDVTDVLLAHGDRSLPDRRVTPQREKGRRS